MKNTLAISQKANKMDKEENSYPYYKGCLFFHISEESVFDLHNGVTTIRGVLTFSDSRGLNSEYKELRINLSEKDTPEFIRSYCKILNPIQGIFHKVCQSLKDKPFSVIVSSPTSSGKTGIILLYINHLLSILNKNYKDTNGSNTSGGNSENSNFSAEECPKIVYVAPLKSLVSEKYDEFRRIFGNVVDIRTGDVIDKKEIKNPILVCTPDYLNLAFRNKLKFTENIRSIIIDEVHTVLTGGVTLDEILYFTKRRGLNFLLLSATIPKLDSLIEFISPNVVIKSSWTPVKLEKRYKKAFGERGNKKEKDEQDSGSKAIDVFAYVLFEEALEAIEKGEAKKVIIFVYSKNLGWDILRVAAESYGFKILNDPDTVPFEVVKLSDEETLSLEQDKRLDSQCDQVNCSGIKGLKEEEKLIAFHCADLDLKERAAIERSFRSKDGLRILVATQTLAYGVNLPADAVVIGINNLSNGMLIPSLIDCIQMAGRAGRFGISDRGIVTFVFKNSKHADKAKDSLESDSSDYGVSIRDPNILFQIIFFNLSEEGHEENLRHNSFLFNNLKVNPDKVDKIINFLSTYGFTTTISVPLPTSLNASLTDSDHIFSTGLNSTSLHRSYNYKELTSKGRFCYSQNVFPPHLVLSEIFNYHYFAALQNANKKVIVGGMNKNYALYELLRRDLLEFLSLASLYQGGGRSTLKHVCDAYKEMLRFSDENRNYFFEMSGIVSALSPPWHQSRVMIQVLKHIRSILDRERFLGEVFEQFEFLLSLTSYITGTYYILGIPRGFSDVSYISPSSFLHLARVLFLANRNLKLFNPFVIETFLYAFWYKVMPFYLDLVLLFKAVASELKRDFGAAKKFLLINGLNKFLFDLNDYYLFEYLNSLLKANVYEDKATFLKEKQCALLDLVYLLRRNQNLFLDACYDVLQIHLDNRKRVRGKADREKILENYKVIEEVTKKISDMKSIKIDNLYNDPFIKTTINKIFDFIKGR